MLELILNNPLTRRARGNFNITTTLRVRGNSPHHGSAMLRRPQKQKCLFAFFLFFSAPNIFYKKEKNISVLLSARKLAEKAFPKTKEEIVLFLQYFVLSYIQHFKHTLGIRLGHFR